VVDDTVLENEGAHARPFAHERGPIDSGPPYVLVRGAGRLQRVLAMIVVFDVALTLLLLSETDAVVKVEIAAERRGPIRRWYPWSLASGARDTAQSITSWLAK